MDIVQYKNGLKPAKVNAVSGHSDVKIAALEKKLKASDDFLASTLKLRERLEKDDVKAVAELLKRRSGIIATIDELDRRIVGYLQSSSADRSSAVIPEAMKMTEEINKRLRQAEFANQECETLAAGRRQELRNELATVNREAEGLRGYAQRGGKPPKFLNIRT
ncbi:MAG: hypothetical protein ACYC6Q_11245 [Syntrophales bacterium]